VRASPRRGTEGRRGRAARARWPDHSRLGGSFGLPARECAEGDPGDERKPAGELRGPEGVAERRGAGDRADQRLEVDERPRELRRDPRLPEGEEDERQ